MRPFGLLQSASSRPKEGQLLRLDSRIILAMNHGRCDVAPRKRVGRAPDEKNRMTLRRREQRLKSHSRLSCRGPFDNQSTLPTYAAIARA